MYSVVFLQFNCFLGDEKKPKAWSKYAPDSNAYKKLHNKENTQKKIEKVEPKKKEKSKIDEKLLSKLKKVNTQMTFYSLTNKL